MLGRVPLGCRQRLTAHYGPTVTGWLDRVPGVVDVAARAWNLRLRGYHDAGHASALALAENGAGEPVVLKAWFDHDRYMLETAALRRWEPLNGRVVRAQDDEWAVACLGLVGELPGGGPRPADDERRVAEALARLHAQLAPAVGFPTLEDYLRRTVEPRILRRLRRFGAAVPQRCVDLGLNAVPMPTRKRPVLLHADLYWENVPFEQGGPVFLDPLPMLGDPAYDWAFFTVYYDLARDPVARLHVASQVSGIDRRALLPWCLRLCLDGLLYYREVADKREPRMAAVMIALAVEERPG